MKTRMWVRSVLVGRNFDQDDIRVGTQTVEYDALSGGIDVEAEHGGVVVQLGQRASRHPGAGREVREVEQPEVLRWAVSLHVHQSAAIREETKPIAETDDVDLGKLDPCTVRGVNPEQRMKGHVLRPGVDDEVIRGRPDRIPGLGVREAQVTEMRARRQAAERMRDATRDRVRTEVREALFQLDAAERRWRVHLKELVPLAERSFESTRGAYEGNRAGYIELLDSARRLLRARLGRIDAERGRAHARARLLQAVGVRVEERR